MPNRLLRVQTLTSRRHGAGSAEAECLYNRLMLVADDFGRFHGDPQLIQSACYPRGERDCTPAFLELLEDGRVRQYEHEGEPYVVFEKWNQTTRAKESRFPEPPPDVFTRSTSATQTSATRHTDVEHLQADVCLDGDVDGDVTSSVTVVDRPDVEGLCVLLADLIEGNGSRRPTIGERWRDAARLMLDNDHRDHDEAERLIRWCQADEFWRSNVLSMPKFRERYDQLKLKAQRTRGMVDPNDVTWGAG